MPDPQPIHVDAQKREADMKIATVLARKGNFVATLPPAATVSTLLDQLAEHGIGALVVSADGTVITGMVSERDVVRALLTRGTSLLDAPISQIMTPVIATCTVESPVEELMVLMTEERVRHIPVVDEDGLLAGIVSIGDVVKSRIDQLETEHQALRAYITS